jgi:hypothetical protein
LKSRRDRNRKGIVARATANAANSGSSTGHRATVGVCTAPQPIASAALAIIHLTAA